MDSTKQKLLKNANLSQILIDDYKECDRAREEAGLTDEVVERTLKELRERIDKRCGSRKSFPARLYGAFFSIYQRAKNYF